MRKCRGILGPSIDTTHTPPLFSFYTTFKKPTFVSFWFPRNLSNHMDRQARTRDTVLVKSRKNDRKKPSIAVAAGGGGLLDDLNTVCLTIKEWRHNKWEICCWRNALVPRIIPTPLNDDFRRLCPKSLKAGQAGLKYPQNNLVEGNKYSILFYPKYMAPLSVPDRVADAAYDVHVPCVPPPDHPLEGGERHVRHSHLSPGLFPSNFFVLFNKMSYLR